MVLKLGRNNERVIYYPGAVVYHCVSGDRFSKRYLRLNSYHFGKWRYLSESQLPSKRLKILGMPLWMYRSTFEAAAMMICLTLLGRRKESFFQERRMLVYLGYFAAARKRGRSKEMLFS
jgi:GT2 family glycosyltransferase